MYKAIQTAQSLFGKCFLAINLIFFFLRSFLKTHGWNAGPSGHPSGFATYTAALLPHNWTHRLVRLSLKFKIKPSSAPINKFESFPRYSTAVGVVYPAYASFKAVEVMRVRNDTAEASKWLTYWAVYGTLTALERFSLDSIVPWVPYYTTVKLALLLWLQIPRYSGAYRLARQFAYPVLHRTHAQIDALLVMLEQHVNRPEMQAMAAAIHEVLSRIPVLEWFVRGPDGRPLPPPLRRPSPPPNGGFITGR